MADLLVEEPVGRPFRDNSLVESFFGTLQLELLDQHQWDTRAQLANAIFEWIEAFNRGGDRQLNRALHTIVLTRSRTDPETRAYTHAASARARPSAKATQSLKRIMARKLFRLL